MTCSVNGKHEKTGNNLWIFLVRTFAISRDHNKFMWSGRNHSKRIAFNGTNSCKCAILTKHFAGELFLKQNNKKNIFRYFIVWITRYTRWDCGRWPRRKSWAQIGTWKYFSRLWTTTWRSVWSISMTCDCQVNKTIALEIRLQCFVENEKVRERSFSRCTKACSSHT